MLHHVNFWENKYLKIKITSNPSSDIDNMASHDNCRTDISHGSHAFLYILLFC